MWEKFALPLDMMFLFYDSHKNEVILIRNKAMLAPFSKGGISNCYTSIISEFMNFLESHAIFI